MKKAALILITLFTSVTAILGQNYYIITFDPDADPVDLNGNFLLYTDTLSNPANSWQIGAPQKTAFTEASSAPNVIVTDTLNTYPVNDHSSFIIRHVADYGLTSHYFELYADYQVNSDTLTDYGMLELSVDDGSTWIDLFNDPVWSAALSWNNSAISHSFSGNSNGWNSFYFLVHSSEIAYLGIEFGDTVLFRFSFISDGNETFKDGLMFDNISIWDTPPIGIAELSTGTFASTAYPNPVHEKLTVRFDNPANHSLTLELLDHSGKLVQKTATHHTKQVTLNTEKLPAGIYFYSLKDEQTGAVSLNQFIVR